MGYMGISLILGNSISIYLGGLQGLGFCHLHGSRGSRGLNPKGRHVCSVTLIGERTLEKGYA